MASILTRLTRNEARPGHIVLDKLPVYDGEVFVTVQSTGRAFHAYRIFNRRELVSSIEALGFEAYSGLYFRLASA